jgi:STE24 endopeptidase
MNATEGLKVFILFLILAGFVFNLILNYLSGKGWDKPIPEMLVSLYDSKAYSKAKRYHKEAEKMGRKKGILSLILILLMIGGGFNFLDQWARSITHHPIGLPILFFGVLFFASEIVSLPFRWYEQFRIESKYDFNRSTQGTFWLDSLKGWLLTILIGGGLMSLIIWIYIHIPNYFWVAGWGAITLFSLSMSFFYVRILLPVFNKLTPLEDGELKSAIESFADASGFTSRRIFVMDGSKRSTKANAFFSGFGKEKTIVLYDTLIERQTTDEIVAILAHEIGHYKLKHIPQGLVFGIVQSFITFFLLGLFLTYPEVSRAIGFEEPGFHSSLITFALLLTPLNMIVGFANQMISRKNEYQADAYAASFDLGQPLGTALIKMSAFHLSNLYPHKWDVWMNYSHPTLIQRLQAMNYKSEKNESVSTTA